MEIDLFIQKKLTLIENLLSFQKKVHLNNITLEESFVGKVTYINSFQESMVNNLFPNNSLVNESYHKIFGKLIIESKIDFSIEIEKFNYFIISEIKNEIFLIKEQVNSLGSSVTSLLSKSVEYITKYGIGRVMEGLRKALLSGVGTAIQIALSFTGAGAIANDVAWGILTLYDAYLYFTEGNAHLFNLLIDILCLLSGGTLGKVLGKWVGKAASSLGEAFQKLITTEKGLLPVFSKIADLGQILMNNLTKAGTFMSEKMGIKWVQKWITKIKDFFTKYRRLIKIKEGKLISNVAEKISGSELMKKIPNGMAAKLESLGSNIVNKFTKKGITKQVLGIIDKKIKEATASTSEEILKWIDKDYGSSYADLYSEYLNLKKLAKHQGNITYGTVDAVTDAAMQKNTLDKTSKLVSKAKKSYSKLTS